MTAKLIQSFGALRAAKPAATFACRALSAVEDMKLNRP
jgi:hypothetical protein